MKRILLLLLVLLPCLGFARHRTSFYNLADYARYEAANKQLKVNPFVVFMGDSILDGWDDHQPEYFNDNNFACRGISSQVTGQMLVRFRADVIALNPKAVVILAGANDLAVNGGDISMENILGNVISMVELAKSAGIRPILCSVLPAGKFYWRPEVNDAPQRIADLNTLLKEYAQANKVTWVDLHQVMDAGDGSMKTEYTKDGVHPTFEGYNKMQECLYPYLKKYIKKS